MNIPPASKAASAPTNPAALHGIRVLDLSRMLAGPWCTQTWADLGADAQRVRHRAELIPQLETVLKTRTKANWLAALDAAKVPCGPINNLVEVFADPQVQQRGMVQHWEHPYTSDLRLVASPMKPSVTPPYAQRSPPC